MSVDEPMDSLVPLEPDEELPSEAESEPDWKVYEKSIAKLKNPLVIAKSPEITKFKDVAAVRIVKSMYGSKPRSVTIMS